MRTPQVILSLVICLSSLLARASFEENSRRYLSAQEIIQAMQVHFELTHDCMAVTAENSSMLGVNSAVTGGAIAPAPTQSTVQFVAGCVSKASERFATPTPIIMEKLKPLVGPDFFAYLSQQFPTGNFSEDVLVSARLVEKWSKVPAEIRPKLIESMVWAMLGSDELINDFGLINPSTLRAKLSAWADDKPDLNVIQMIQFISVNLAVRDEFLSY